MALRELDPKMIASLHDVVEMRLIDLSTRLEATLADRAKEVFALFETSLAN